MATKSKSGARSSGGRGASRSGGRRGNSQTSRGKNKASARELISPRGDKRYVRRDNQGQFKESDDVGRSLSRDRRTHAKAKAKRGRGDRGDR